MIILDTMQTVFIVFQLINLMVAATTTVTIEYGMSNNQNIDLISKGILFDVRKYPFLVYIRLFKSSGVVSECSGSLISPLFVLTAAHCTDKIEANNIVVFHYYNLFMKSQQYVKAVYQHKSYKKNLIYNDISIIRLKYPFRNVNRYLNLSGHPDEFNDTADWNCTVFGFGISERSNNYEKLGYMTNLSVTYGYKKCFLDILDYQFRQWPWNKTLCSKPNIQCPCSGDSGGPLVCNGNQYGITSFVYTLNGKCNCGNPKLQAAFVFIHFYRDWISDIVNINTGNLIKLHKKLLNISVILMVSNF